jgi:hypothetical protein
MGSFFAIGRCICCGRHFTFHPERVPSLTVDGRREPVCRTCVDRINPVRKANGLAEIVPLPGAYKPGLEEDDFLFLEGGE